MTHHINGTLVLYDSENMKVPVKKSAKTGYTVPKVDMKTLTGKILARFPDTHYSFVAFSKTYHSDKDPRIAASNRFKKTLEDLGYFVVEKVTTTKSEVAIRNGRKVINLYEECDMDGEIIHYMHTVGKNFGRVILISGDSDMKPTIDHLISEYMVEVWIISHSENLSRKYIDENNVLTLYDLISFKESI